MAFPCPWLFRKSPDTHVLKPKKAMGVLTFTDFYEQGSGTLPFRLKDYLELVGWGGREVKRNKRGYIPVSAPPILDRLQMNAVPVLKYLARGDSSSPAALGPVSMLRAFAASIGRKFIKGHVFGSSLCPERA